MNKPQVECVLKKPANVMIIDDDVDLREVVSWAFAREGYAVQAFNDPIDAVEFLKLGRNLPGLILADYHMYGMKGGEFLTMKNLIPAQDVQACPVVMISASPNDVEKDVPREHYKEMLTKPLDLKGLVINMKKYLQ
ncbi:MAG TPA: response regulator [Bacteriovoracaceae bacterium]|nr:response regulator [Bacteriovoracaceae bacterium]